MPVEEQIKGLLQDDVVRDIAFLLRSIDGFSEHDIQRVILEGLRSGRYTLTPDGLRMGNAEAA